MNISNEREKNDTEKLEKQIINCAERTHEQLGPGFPENLYGEIMTQELRKNNLNFSNQSEVKVKYDGRRFGDRGVELGNQKVDMIVENEIAIKLKSALSINVLFEEQMQLYLNISGKKTGLIINFGSDELEIRKMVKKQ